MTRIKTFPRMCLCPRCGYVHRKEDKLPPSSMLFRIHMCRECIRTMENKMDQMNTRQIYSQLIKSIV